MSENSFKINAYCLDNQQFVAENDNVILFGRDFF